jgi:filamentous hemagglutinin family protein
LALHHQLCVLIMMMAPYKKTVLAICIASACAQLAAQTVAPTQLPTGGKVVAGQAVIQQSGSALNINQATQRAAIDWNTFNVGKDAQVNFNQPSSSALTLNRVLDTNASQIMGRISAPGQVFLVNPNGVLFGPNSQVDVGGLVATTQNISNADFMAGKSTFEGDGRSGVSVVNQGQLNAALGGYIALLAPQVRNEGVVVAREGTVALAAGDKSVIEFSGTRMTSVLVDRAVMDALVENRQVIRADGGLVLLSARSANAILNSVITNSGTVQANTVVNKNGRIVLEGGEQGVVQVSGTLQASGVDAGTQGGSVVVTGDKVQIASGAQLDASGKAGGGSVLVGGGWQGQDPTIRQANAVVVESGARLDASAVDQGNGGTVVAWSNTQNANSVTRVSGELLARGGANGGDGGKIETSGHWLSTDGVKGDATAAKGKGGEWLFDPYDVTISNATTYASHPTSNSWTSSGSAMSYVKSSDIETLLNQGTNVTVSTGTYSTSTDGNITVSSPITGTGAGGAAKLTLAANHNIAVSNTISVAGSGSMVELNAGKATGSGNVSFDAAVNVDTLSVNVAGIGTVTQSAALTTNNLKLTGSNTDVTLSQTSNKVGTIAADVKSLTLVNNIGAQLNSTYGTGLYVGTVDGLSGINALGRISITMNNGNIFLDKNIATTATDTSITAPALMLNAGANLSPSATPMIGVNPYGPNIVRLGTSTLTVGSGGRAMLYTGSVDGGSAALASYVGTGSGRFRYNNDESTLSASLAAGLTPLLSGVNVIYRQQPLLSVSSSTTQTYGITSAITPTFSGYANGDSLASSVSNPTGLTVAIAGPVSTAGYYTAGDHALTVSGAQSNLGYGFSYLPSNLTVNKKGLTVSAVASTKTYDGLTAATSQLSTDKFALDNVVVTSASSNFSDKNAGAGKTVTVTGLALSSGTDAGNYIILNSGATATTTSAITAKSITATYTAQNKTYDGTTTATVVGSSNDILAGDTVTFVNGVATFANKNANAAGTQVSLTSISLGGTDGTNYSISNPSSNALSAVISPKTITASFTASAKTYDGNTTATVTGSTASFLGGDTPTYTGVVATFDDKNAGTGKNVNISGYSLTGTGATNYVLQNSTATATADISKKTASMSGVTATGKTYDGTTSATVSGGSMTGLIAGDAVSLQTVGTYSDKNVGTNKTVTIAATYTGTDAGNYTFTNQATTTASITARSLAIAAIGQNKEYDGTNTATYSLTSNQIAGDALTLQATSGVFDSKNVSLVNGGTQNVTIGGITVAGADATNYTQQNTSTTTTAKVLPKALTATVNASNKTYDGTTSATASLTGVQGFVGQESVSVDSSSVSATFNSKDVASANTVSVNAGLLDGSNGGLGANYTINGQTGTAHITPKDVTVSAITASNKTYDGNTTAQITSGTVANTVGGETLSVSGVGTFNNKNVGTSKAVSVADVTALTKQDGTGSWSNYNLVAGSQTTTANISKKDVTLDAITASNKTYDGNTAAAVYGVINSGSVSGTVAGETLSVSGAGVFNDKNAGTNKAVTVADVTGLTKSNGTGDWNNYNLTTTGSKTTVANITPKDVTVSAITASNKTYDGNTTAQITSGTVADTVGVETLSVSGVGTFIDKNVGAGKTVNVADVTALTKQDGTGSWSNYNLVAGSQTTTANISKKDVTLDAITASNKTYDGNTVAAVSGVINSGSASGTVAGETLSVSGAGVFNDKNAGTNKVVTVADVTGLTKSNGTGDWSNYNLTTTGSKTTAADIDKAQLTASVAAQDKWYDGTTTAKATVTNIQGLVGNETLSARVDSAEFNSADPQAAKNVKVTALTLTSSNGFLSSNYEELNPTLASAKIRPMPLGCVGNCSQPGASSSVSAKLGSVTPLVAGVTAGAIKRSSYGDASSLQMPTAVQPIPSSSVVSGTSLDTSESPLSATNVNQVRRLSSDQVASLAPAKLAELMPVLTPKQLMAVTPDQMAGLDATQLNQLVSLMDNALSKMKR